MADNASSRREKAAQVRSSSMAQQAKRDRNVRIVGAVTVVVVVIAIIGLAVFARSSSDAGSTASIAQPDPSAPSPTGVLAGDDARAYGVPYGTPGDGVPVLEIWEDFQCPACGSVERANGAGIAELAESGQALVVWRPTTFLDRNLGNDASERAAGAWGCAIDQGKTREFHDLVYENQPTVEGDGWTNEQLIAFGEQAGISGDGLTTFTQCVNDGTYRAWAANSTKVFYDSGIGGTPTALLNGASLPTEVLIDPAALKEAVAAAAK